MINKNNFYLPEKEWLMRESYEQKNFIKTMKYIKNKNVAIDCGAHIGVWSKRLSQIFNKVICFEPVPRHRECHKLNCISNNIELYDVALSNKNLSKVPMKLNYGNSGKSSMDFEGLKKKVRKNEKIINVKTKTLDSYNFKKVDFIKIDVEGFELFLLEGAKETIKKYKPIIYMEDWKKTESGGLAIPEWFGYSSGSEYLISLNYKEIERLSGSNFIFAPL